MGWFEVIPPTRYREASTRVAGSDVARSEDDEEPSPVTVRVYLVSRQRRRPTTLQIAVLGGLGLAVVTVGIFAVRSLMGAS
jgi:hypothetical protein